MSRTRFALSAAIWTAVALSFPCAAGAAPPAANVPAPIPPGKPAEVSTVGTTPAVLTTAERLKFALFESQRAARSVRPGGPGRPIAGLPPELLRPSVPFETRVPATGPRDRTKPVHTAREAAEREKGGGR